MTGLLTMGIITFPNGWDKTLTPTTTIKIGRDDRYASSVVSIKFGAGRKVSTFKALRFLAVERWG